MDEDDPYDLEADARREEQDDYYREQVEAEYGEEIRDSVDREDLVSGMAQRHSEEWSRVAYELKKAEKRLNEGEQEEAIFHASRAFDGYIGAVCVGPIREQIVAKFERLLPNVTEGDILKQVTGLGGGMTFASFAISAAVEEKVTADAVVERFRLFIGTREKYGEWQERNPVFHTTKRTNVGKAKAFLTQIGELLGQISSPLQRIVDEREARRKLEHASPAHVFAAKTLAELFEDDQGASLTDFEWPKPTNCEPCEIQNALHKMLQEGFVERMSGGADGRWKLTPRGYGHWRKDLKPSEGTAT